MSTDKPLTREDVVRLLQQAGGSGTLDLGNRNLRGIDLSGLDLRIANLEGTNLSRADLNHADLRGVNLSKAHLFGADLREADLSEANLRGVTGITLEELKKQAKLKDTTVPDGSVYPGATTPKSSSSEQTKAESFREASRTEQTREKNTRSIMFWRKKGQEKKGVTVDLTSFPQVNSVAALCAAIEAGGKGILRFPSLTYPEVYRNLLQQLEKRYGQSSRQSQDMMSSLLLCAGCLGEFPGSYMLSLLTGESFGGRGKAGICPQCGNRESLLVYEYFPAEQISMSDVYAIRRYWQQLARTWWQSQQGQQAFCDYCHTTAIARNQGYLSGSSLICEGCVTRGLMTEGLEKLKSDSHYCGAVLIKARHPGATTPKSSTSEQHREQTKKMANRPRQAQGMLILTRFPMSQQAIQTLMQQIADQQRSNGHSIAPNFRASVVTAGDDWDNIANTYGVLAAYQQTFPDLASADFFDRTREFSFQASDGNLGKYYIVFDRP